MVSKNSDVPVYMTTETEKDELDKAFCAEMVLWSLSNNSKLDRTASESAFKFENSILSAYLSNTVFIVDACPATFLSSFK